MKILAIVSPQDVLEAGRGVGTASNQVVLGSLLVLLIFCILALAGVIAWLHRDNKRTIAGFIDKMERKESDMTTERKDRITSLMHLLERDIAVQEQVKHAIDNNTTAIKDLKEFLKDYVLPGKKLLK